jgi:hypothetical protein
MASIPKFTLGLAAGAALAYYFDPVSGRGRRTRLRDQLKAEARDAVDQAGRKARYQAGRLKGAVHEFVAGGTDVPADDAELLQKIRSEAIGPSGLDTDDVDLVVEGGTVVIRTGDLPDTALDDLLRRIAAVTGVTAVHTRAA